MSEVFEEDGVTVKEAWKTVVLANLALALEITQSRITIDHVDLLWPDQIFLEIIIDETNRPEGEKTGSDCAAYLVTRSLQTDFTTSDTTLLTFNNLQLQTVENLSLHRTQPHHVSHQKAGVGAGGVDGGIVFLIVFLILAVLGGGGFYFYKFGGGRAKIGGGGGGRGMARQDAYASHVDPSMNNPLPSVASSTAMPGQTSAYTPPLAEPMTNVHISSTA